MAWRHAKETETYQGDDDFAIGGGLEVVGRLQALADKTVVVDLAVGGEDDALIGIGERLGSALCSVVSMCHGHKDNGARPTNADDTEPLMAQN